MSSENARAAASGDSASSAAGNGARAALVTPIAGRWPGPVTPRASSGS